jgi:hypothetical protein
MLVNDLTFYELERIIKPVLQMQSMHRVCSEIGQVLGIAKPNREKITDQEKFSLRYRDFQVSISLGWLSGRGAYLILQFARPATKWQTRQNTWFGESHRRMDRVCCEVVKDLKSICIAEMSDIQWIATDVTGHGYHESKELVFRVAHPKGAFNPNWKQGFDATPLGISDDYNSAGQKWFVSLTFNPGAFFRKGAKTVLRDNWQEYGNDISTSIDAWVKRRPHFSGHPLTFAEWCEDMILDFGDEVAPQLPEVWQEIQNERSTGLT